MALTVQEPFEPFDHARIEDVHGYDLGVPMATPIHAGDQNDNSFILTLGASKFPSVILMRNTMNHPHLATTCTYGMGRRRVTRHTPAYSSKPVNWKEHSKARYARTYSMQVFAFCRMLHLVCVL